MNTTTKPATRNNTQRLVRIGKPPLRRTMQGHFVLYALSLLLNLFVGASLIATLKGRLTQPAHSARARWLRPLIGLGTVAPWLYLVWLRPWHRRWGATEEEVHKPLLGDELAAEPAVQTTRAVTVHAPVHQVWPWLAQLGQERGGFYSYDLVENLAATDAHTTDRVHAKRQPRGIKNAVDNIVELSPYVGLPVAVFEPHHAPLKGWSAFVLEPIDTHTTRLLARTRTPYGGSAILSVLFMELPHFILERKMLLAVKLRVEQYAQSTAKMTEE